MTIWKDPPFFISTLEFPVLSVVENSPIDEWGNRPALTEIVVVKAKLAAFKRTERLSSELPFEDFALRYIGRIITKSKNVSIPPGTLGSANINGRNVVVKNLSIHRGSIPVVEKILGEKILVEVEELSRKS